MGRGDGGEVRRQRPAGVTADPAGQTSRAGRLAAQRPTAEDGAGTKEAEQEKRGHSSGLVDRIEAVVAEAVENDADDTAADQASHEGGGDDERQEGDEGPVGGVDSRAHAQLSSSRRFRRRRSLGSARASVRKCATACSP